jgi:hypothetical protein
MKLINKIKKATDTTKKTAIWQKANLSKDEADQLVKEMVLSVPKGCYKLHGREYGTNLVDIIYDMYGWMPSMFVDERMVLGLQELYPDKVYASFTLGLDAIEIK